jgi:16S rRNA (guanine527-N7)-methyltransferase
LSAPFDFRLSLERGAADLGVSLDGDALDRLVTYQALLARWTPKIRLVSNPRPEATWEIHFLDSLALLRLLPDDGRTWSDIGSGAGFPGAVLAAARPGWPFQLIEPIHKRSAFLLTLVAQLPLRGTKVVARRSDALARGSCDGLVSRATLPPQEWLTEAGRLLSPGGLVCVMTARGLDAEAKRAADVAGLELAGADSFELPVSGVPRTNLLFRRSPA